MSENRNWQTELDAYIKQGEPTKAERSDAWKTAIGLQTVDGLRNYFYHRVSGTVFRKPVAR